MCMYILRISHSVCKHHGARFIACFWHPIRKRSMTLDKHSTVHAENRVITSIESKIKQFFFSLDFKWFRIFSSFTWCRKRVLKYKIRWRTGDDQYRYFRNHCMIAAWSLIEVLFHLFLTRPYYPDELWMAICVWWTLFVCWVGVKSRSLTWYVFVNPWIIDTMFWFFLPFVVVLACERDRKCLWTLKQRGEGGHPWTTLKCKPHASIYVAVRIGTWPLPIERETMSTESCTTFRHLEHYLRTLEFRVST